MKQGSVSKFLHVLLPLSCMLLSVCGCVKADISLTDEQLGAQVMPPGVYGPPVPNRDKFHYVVTSPEQAFSVKLKMWDPGYMPTSNIDNTNGAIEVQIYAQTGAGTGDVSPSGESGQGWIYVGGYYNSYYKTDIKPVGTQCWYCGRLIGFIPGEDPYPSTYSGAKYYATPF